MSGLSVPQAGEYFLHVWLEDAAGNQREANAAVAAPLRFDPEPPRLGFQPASLEDPLRVVVDAMDTHSGLARGEIEMRAIGGSTWHGLPTEVGPEALVAHVDDERFRNGAYEFRARAIDHAGNEASTGRRSDGQMATLRLPARIETKLVVGVARRVIRRVVVRRNGKRRVIRRAIRTFDDSVTARHGRSVRLSGFLSSSDGQPVDGATIEALDSGPDGPRTIGLATTDSEGRFSYVAKASQEPRLWCSATEDHDESAPLTMPSPYRVPARSSMRPSRSRLRNGQQVIFSGRVTTRPVPAHGKLLEMQSHFRGRWRTFSTVRTRSDGRWRFAYRFGATVGRVTYPVQGAFACGGGLSVR